MVKANVSPRPKETQRDFTIATYSSLLEALIGAGYTFQTFADFLLQPADKAVVLRHDVDARKERSLQFARIQHRLGLQGTYFFRVVPQSFDPKVITQIHDLGHEIGYHYEDMDFAQGDPHRAVTLFEEHLRRLREIAPIRTICMHGSPRSRYDNRDVWTHYDYRNYDLIGEPYFDVDFSRVFYLTDTGRRWDGHRVSVRDKVKQAFPMQFHRTFEIMDALRQDALPSQIMMTFHPQRWTDAPLDWFVEKQVQRLKNTLKFLLIQFRNG